MNTFIKRYWVALLGVVFIFLSLLYFARVAYLEGWLPPIALVALGLVLGVTGLIGGWSLHQNYQKPVQAQAAAGMGAGVIYASLVYAGFAPDILWPLNVVIVCVIGLSLLVAWAGSVMQMRILTNLSLASGLVSPIILQADIEQIFLLFLYLLVLNVVALLLSVVRGWHELRMLGFVLTLINYTIYFINFEPEVWYKPFQYILIFYLAYAIGLIAASAKEENRFIGMNLYLGLINAVSFLFWCFLIFDRFGISHRLPIMGVGLAFMVSALAIRILSREAIIAYVAYFFLGLLVMAAAGPGLAKFFKTPGLEYVVQGAIWLGLATAVYATGIYMRNWLMVWAAMLGWCLILLFWYAVAWDVSWVRWFGLRFIPFLNPGALLWLALALIGFHFAAFQLRTATVDETSDKNDDPDKIVYDDATEQNEKDFRERFHKGFAYFFASMSHIVMACLLTIQVQNMWDAYPLGLIMKEGLALTLVWGIYAGSLTFWGAFTRTSFFRWSGLLVLIGVAMKALIWDLSGQATVFKAGLLFLLGLVMMAVWWIDRHWHDDQNLEHDSEGPSSDESTAPDVEVQRMMPPPGLRMKN